MDPIEVEKGQSNQERGRAKDLDRVRMSWERWGPSLTALVAVVATLLAAAYGFSKRDASLENVEVTVKELKDDLTKTSEEVARLNARLEGLNGSLSGADRGGELLRLRETMGELGTEVSQIGRLVAAGSARTEQLDWLKADHQALRNKQSEDMQRISSEIRDVAVRLTRIEVSLKLNNMISSGKFEGGVLRTPNGEKFYGPSDVEKFRTDADKLIGTGGGFRVRDTQFYPETHTCEPGPTPDCIKIAFFDASRGEGDAYALEARVFSPERLASSAAEPWTFKPCTSPAE